MFSKSISKVCVENLAVIIRGKQNKTCFLKTTTYFLKILRVYFCLVQSK